MARAGLNRKAQLPAAMRVLLAGPGVAPPAGRSRCPNPPRLWYVVEFAI